MKIALIVLAVLIAAFAVLAIRAGYLLNRFHRQCDGVSMKKPSCEEGSCKKCPYYSGRS